MVFSLLFVVAACSQTTTVGAETPESDSGRASSEPANGSASSGVISDAEMTARGMAVVQDPPAELPSAFSNTVQIGDLGFYYAASDGAMSLIAFDTATLTPQYQISANPLDRIRGVGQELIGDEDLGLVFVTGYDAAIDGVGGAYLAGHQATTGEELWRTSISLRSAQPRDCGSALCVRAAIEERMIDKASGTLVDFQRVTDRRVLHGSADLTVTTRSGLRTGTFAGLAGFSAYGFDPEWELDAAQILRAAGVPVDPGYGWGADFFTAENIVIVHLARTDADSWMTLGLDADTGSIEWTRDDVWPCVLSPLPELPPVLCVHGADPFTAETVERVDPLTGAAVWSLDIPDGTPELNFDGTKLVMWTFSEADDSSVNTVIDLSTGEQSTGARADLCQLGSPWQDFTLPDGQTLQWASALLFTMCSNDGYLLYADEVTAMAPTLALGSNVPIWLVDGAGAPIAVAG